MAISLVMYIHVLVVDLLNAAGKRRRLKLTVGGVTPEGFVTEKVSVRQLEANETGTPLPNVVTSLPLRISVSVAVNVEGPVMTNMSKSSLS